MANYNSSMINGCLSVNSGKIYAKDVILKGTKINILSGTIAGNINSSAYVTAKQVAEYIASLKS